jgi:hypothetical protein
MGPRTLQNGIAAIRAKRLFHTLSKRFKSENLFEAPDQPRRTADFSELGYQDSNLE